MARLRVGDGADQRLAILRYLHACGLGNLKRGAADHLAVELAAGKGVVLDFLRFLLGAHMCALTRQRLLHLRGDFSVQHDH